MSSSSFVIIVVVVVACISITATSSRFISLVLFVLYVVVLIYQKLHAPIVRVHKLTNLLQIKCLKIIHLSAVVAGKSGLVLFVEDDGVAGQVDSSRDGVLDNKFTNLFDEGLFGDIELLANVSDREALVLRFTFNYENLECGVFESAQKLLFQLAFLEFLKSCKHGYS